MSYELASSFVLQLFTNHTQETASVANTTLSHALHTAFSLANPWMWKWTFLSESALFLLLTTKPAQELLPPHWTISNGLFLSVFFFCLTSLYALLLSPYPRTTRGKQILALPLLAMMLLEPLLFDCSFNLHHMAVATTSIAIAMRMVDLYYIQSWTGIPSRYSPQAPCNPSPMDSVAKAKKDLGDDKKASSARNMDKILLWDRDRLEVEMWSPFRKFSGRKNRVTASPGLRWQDLIPISVAYSIVFDVNIFVLSWYTSEQMDAMAVPQYALFMGALGAFIMVQILCIYVTIAIIFGVSTGRTIKVSEWTMLGHKLPCFALTPVDFWNNWHTLFRYIWVDLGFLPVQRACEQHLGPDRVGPLISQLARQSLPVMAVFALSGVLHAYIVYAVWREPMWSQLFYFTVQGVGVILTKAVEGTVFGARVRDAYNTGSPLVRRSLTAMGLLMMLFYHALTLPFFMDPYKKHNMWLELKERSILWWIYGR